jgi:hypothetical protein
MFATILISSFIRTSLLIGLQDPNGEHKKEHTVYKFQNCLLTTAGVIYIGNPIPGSRTILRLIQSRDSETQSRDFRYY